MEQGKFQTGSGVNIGLLHDFLRKDILERVSSAGTSPSKCVVLDPPLIRIVSPIVEKPAFASVGVDSFFPLEKSLPSSCPPNIVYFCRPIPATMKLIAQQIKAHIKAGAEKEYTIFFVPNKTVLCERALEAEGVVANFTQIGECNLFLIPLDSDLMTMDLPLAFREYQLLGDHTCIYHAANAIMQLQTIFGLIPRIVGKGDMAKVLAENLVRLRRELRSQPSNAPEFESIIVLDRAVDLITPMCSQLTYEGLIDEVYGINNSWVELPPHLFPQQTNKVVKAPLTSNDPVYSELRDMNFARVGPYLSRKAKSLSSEYEERHDAKTVSQIKQFTSKLKRMKEEQASIKLHTDIATELMMVAKSDKFHNSLSLEQNFICGNDTDKSNDYIEDVICQQEPIINVLRLMCLQSTINSGLKSKDGASAYIWVSACPEPGESDEDGKFPYSQIRQKFRLVVADNEDGTAAEDISLTYSGYAPLSVRLIQTMCRGEGGRALEDILKSVPGAFVDVEQTLPEGLSQADVAPKQRVSLVFLIGGCTYAEASAIRLLGQQEGRSFVVATTALINGTTLVKSLCDELDAEFVAKPEPAAAAPPPASNTRR